MAGDVRDGHGILTAEEPLPCELHLVPRDTRVDVKTSRDFVLNKGKGPEGRGRFGKTRATAVLNVGGSESWPALFIVRGVCQGEI